jgi:hypothetical protein
MKECFCRGKLDAQVVLASFTARLAASVKHKEYDAGVAAHNDINQLQSATISLSGLKERATILF